MTAYSRGLPFGTPAPDLSSRLTPEAFPGLYMAARQRRFEIKVFLLLDELPSQANERSPLANKIW